MSALIDAEQLKQHLRMTLNRPRPKAMEQIPWLAVVYRGRPAWSGDAPSFQEGGYELQTCTAQSSLELRQRLASVDRDSKHRLVILADIDEVNIAADIRARCLEHRIHDIDPWKILLGRFRAIRSDPRIPPDPELALAMIVNEPAGGFPALPTGVLDLGTFRSVVFQSVLGLPSGAPTAREIILWATQPGQARRLMALTPKVRELITRWVDSESPIAAVLLNLAADGRGLELIPFGLVAEVIHHPSCQAERAGIQAEVRFTDRLGGRHLVAAEAEAWAAVAKHALGRCGADEQIRLRKTAEEILIACGAEGFAILSDIIPLGFEQRMAAFGTTLDGYLDDQASESALIAHVARLAEHWDQEASPHRVRKAQMAVRLARWLRCEVPQADTLDAFASHYRRQLALVDWARSTLSGGDAVQQAGAALSRLAQQALERRERDNERFAQLVADWYAGRADLDDLLTMEDALGEVVPEVSGEKGRVLVLVMDGMSWGVAQELLEDLERRYWTTRARDEDTRDWPATMLSTVPSVTEFARCSLLCGELRRGTADIEKKGFAQHPTLRRLSASSHPPVLFHKGGLEVEGRQGLSDSLRQAIANTRQRIVGVVVNSVDDHLLKDDQTHRTWTVENNRVLEELLEAAKQSTRAVVLCADHGHILDTWAEGRSGGDGGERWRSAKQQAGDGEIQLAGRRLAPFDEALTVPWSERIRYAGKRNGYHGGVTPQELLAPLVVIAHMDQELPGWSAPFLERPAWWNLDQAATEEPVSEPAITPPSDSVEAETPAPAAATSDEPTLFDDQPVEAAPEGAPMPELLAQLIASPVYKAAAKRAGRRRMSDEDVLRMLHLFLQRTSHQLAERELAAGVNRSHVSIRGMVAQLQRLINIDGYRIVDYTQDGGHIRLDMGLLEKQFGLGDAS